MAYFGSACGLALVHFLAWSTVAMAEGCTQPSAPIATDRPDVTNSSIVVPVGSLQNENGINVSRRDGGDVFDGTNSRWRLGIAPCLEVLIDLPNYVGTFRGVGNRGIRQCGAGRQMANQPNSRANWTFSMTMSTASRPVPMRSQVRASSLICNSRGRVELGGGWGISGMETSFFMPANPVGLNSPTNRPS